MTGRAGSAARRPVVVWTRNAFEPHRLREQHALPQAMTPRAWMRRRGIADFDQPTICLIDGAPVLRRDWGRRRIRRGEICTFVTLPAGGGGGGGGGGKNPLRTVLTIAVMVASFALPALAPATMLAPLGNIGLSLGLSPAASILMAQGILGAAVSIAGNVLIAALVPPGKPATPSFSFNAPALGSAPAPSPTYSLQAQGNQARLGQPIPAMYGRHLVYPDIASEPYQEFIDNEQFLYQLHVIGQGEYEIEAIRIEDTPISSFAEVETQVVAPGEAMTLFDPDVVTAPEVAGQSMLGTNEIEEGDPEWIGPFVANPAGTSAEDIGIDVLFPRGLYYAESDGSLSSKTVTWIVEGREIDDDGDPTGDGSWTELGDESHTATGNSTIRLSFRYEVGGGRWEVRLKRTDEKDLSSRAGHDAIWGSLRTYVAETADFTGLTLLAVKMRATDNLSSRSARLINVIATRKLPIWDGETETWSAPTATRSIVWAMADVCRADYGGGLPDTRMALAEWAALDAVLDGRGDYFDAVFDTQMTMWEALTRIARCGRAVPVQLGGRLHLFRDEPQELPVAVFTMRNILRGSFRIRYVMAGEETADAVEVEYFSARTWKPKEVARRVRDAAYESWLEDEELTDGDAARDAWAALDEEPARVRIVGITGADHAAREADYIAADNRFRRRFVTFGTEMDGQIPTYGDLIAVSHDMPRWGLSCEVVAADETDEGDPVLTLSEPPVWTEGETHYLGLRGRDGGLAQLVAVTPGERADEVILAAPLTAAIDVDGDAERTHAAFGPGLDQWSRLCRVTGIRARRGGAQVEISAVVEDDRAHPN